MNISKILNTTSNTLNIINKAIPIYTSFKPMITNTTTLFKGIINSNKTNINTKIIKEDKTKESNSSITFFQ